MKIAIDARWIYAEISGIGAYTRALIAEFARFRGPHEFVLLFCDDAIRLRTTEELGLDAVAGMTTALVPYSIFSPASQLRLPGWLKRNGIDLFHSPNYMIPLLPFPRNRRGRTACVVTIHDLIPMIFREQVAKSKKARLYPVFRWLMRQVASRADSVLTVSESSARDIIVHLKVPAAQQQKVHTVHNGVDPMFEPKEGHEVRFSRGPSEERTLLYVGRSDPYKNIGTLLKAFRKARECAACPLRLVIAGSKDPRYPEAGELCARLGLERVVTWTGYLTHTELLRQYQDADVLLHPSRYEGFGLQVAEAMACGTPVICSNAASLPEVAGDAAVLVSPDDVDGFVDAIVRVVSDGDVQRELSQRGLVQARQFSWQKAAEQTLRVYEALVPLQV